MACTMRATVTPISFKTLRTLSLRESGEGRANSQEESGEGEAKLSRTLLCGCTHSMQMGLLTNETDRACQDKEAVQVADADDVLDIILRSRRQMTRVPVNQSDGSEDT
jgi:hypothetical protein